MIHRLDTTVRDLLTFARPATPSLQELDVGKTLSQAWSILSKQPGAASVRFTLEGPEGVRVSADPQLLQQVWINLFQNAIEAMPEGGSLTVRVTDGPSLRVEISDTGNGVTSAEIEKLFRPFFSTKTRGTGLGLAITRKNVEAHGGKVWVESQPKVKTSVYVEIPK